MHSSQFGITFTDSRGPVNSDGPIHCIRSLNRMVRYSVMPLPASFLVKNCMQWKGGLKAASVDRFSLIHMHIQTTRAIAKKQRHIFLLLWKRLKSDITQLSIAK